jgi:hypothetical protein
MGTAFGKNLGQPEMGPGYGFFSKITHAGWDFLKIRKRWRFWKKNNR